MATATRTEVQAHGFCWEKDLLIIYGATDKELIAIGYTNKVDLPAALNRRTGADLSIKACGIRNAVCMGDCLRIFDNVASGKPYHMVVVRYEQVGPVKRVKSIVELDLTNTTKLLFGDLTRADVEALDTLVKSVPQKRRPTAEEHKAMYALHKSLSQKTGLLSLNIKCDSSQSRLQCSMSRGNLDAFLKNHSERVVASSQSCEFYDGKITAELVSGQRVFKKKDAAATAAATAAAVTGSS